MNKFLQFLSRVLENRDSENEFTTKIEISIFRILL